MGKMNDGSRVWLSNWQTVNDGVQILQINVLIVPLSEAHI